MTLHSAKGLEFDTVFLPGWEEGLFPHQRSLDESGRAGLEEERRLAHVGLTRARKRAKIYFATNRRMHGLWNSTIPSRFLDELPEAHVEVTEAKGGFGNLAGYGGQAVTAPRASTASSRRARAMPRPAGSARRSASATTMSLTASATRARNTKAKAASRMTTAPPRTRCVPSPLAGEGRGEAGGRSEGGTFKQGSHSARGTGTAKGRFAARREPLTIEGELVAKSTGVSSAFTVGDRVFHIKFGNGNVTAVDGNKLTIAFDKAGEKRVVDSFVERV